MRALVLLALVLVLAACGDDDAVVDPPLITGPYPGNLELTEHTRHRLPAALATISQGDTPRFYWHHPDAAGKAITFEVRAETTALEHGTLIHTETVEVPADAAIPQGMFRIDPRSLSQGGARRNERGQLEWLTGLYSVKGKLEGAEPFATGLFEVR